MRTTQGGVPLDAVSRLRRMRGEGGAPLFTSDLSVSEFVLLEQMGWRPLGLVLGSSIYHVGIQYGNRSRTKSSSTSAPRCTKRATSR